MASFFNKKQIFGALSLLCLSLTTSCTNDGDIGDLYGKWQFERMNAYIINNNNTYEMDVNWTVNDCRAYLNFEGEVCQMQIVNDETHELASIWGSFTYTPDSLYISVEKSDYPEGTAAVNGMKTPALLYNFFGMELPDEDEVEDARLRFGYTFSGNKMFLQQGKQLWEYRRYGF